MKNTSLFTALSVALIACTNGGDVKANGSEGNDAQTFADISPVDRKPFETVKIADFDEPWAMTFLPDGQMLVTTKPGKMFQVSQDGTKIAIGGIPEVDYGGQGGLGDIVLAPDFAESGTIYLSWAEAGEGDTRGAVVAKANYSPCPLGAECEQPAITGLKVVWRQDKTSGRGHYSHRIVFSPDGEYMFIGSGDRQKMKPAQDISSNLGKILRLYPDGSVPKDNPFLDKEGAKDAIWSMGHRNILGIAFDSEGKLWNQEMGPRDGDELNLVQRGSNYGWPVVSEGEHYDGEKIPAHDTKPEFNAPETAWVPTIAPSGLIFYSGAMFPEWQGSAFIGGLKSQALIRVSFSEEGAKEAERFKMDRRIREIEQGPDGALWVLEDGEGAGLLRITPVK